MHVRGALSWPGISSRVYSYLVPSIPETSSKSTPTLTGIKLNEDKCRWMNYLLVSITLHDIYFISAFVCGHQSAKYNQFRYATKSHSVDKLLSAYSGKWWRKWKWKITQPQWKCLLLQGLSKLSTVSLLTDQHVTKPFHQRGWAVATAEQRSHQITYHECITIQRLLLHPVCALHSEMLFVCA